MEKFDPVHSVSDVLGANNLIDARVGALRI